MTKPGGHITSVVLLLCLTPVAVFYNSVGFYYLITDGPSSYPIDLRLRWVGQRLVLQGVDPQSHEHVSPYLPSSHHSAIGNYPSWAYATGMILAPPLSWTATRWHFAAINLAALLFIGYWGYHLGSEYGRVSGFAGVVTLAACFPIPICLSYGQYTILIVACFVAAILLLVKGRDGLAGLFLGIALIKPQMAGLVILNLLIRRRFRPVAWAAVYVILASCLTWLLVDRDPVTMFRKTSDEAATYYFLSHNPFLPLLADLLGFRPATMLLALVGVGACVVMSFALGNQAPFLLSFSGCAIITMFWTYRKHYDCVIMILPLLSLHLLRLRNHSLWCTVITLVFGASLWAPLRDTQWDMPVVQYGHAAIWVAGLVTLIVAYRHSLAPRTTELGIVAQ